MMNKGMFSVLFFSIIAILILMVFFLARVVIPPLSKVVDIGQEVDILAEISDETSKPVAMLQARTNEIRVIDSIAKIMAGIDAADSGEEQLTAFADEMDTRLIIQDQHGARVKTLGRRKLGNVLYIDVPLPGGQTGKIGLVTDLLLPEGEAQP